VALPQILCATPGKLPNIPTHRFLAVKNKEANLSLLSKSALCRVLNYSRLGPCWEVSGQAMYPTFPMRMLQNYRMLGLKGTFRGQVMGDSVKSLAQAKVENIHCSCLIYPASYATTEGYQIGQA